jgi:aminomethyltransferase
MELPVGIIPTPGECAHIGIPQIGVVTSAMKPPGLGNVTDLARVDIAHADIGTALEIGRLDGDQKRLNATVVRVPHLDPAKERVKGNYS